MPYKILYAPAITLSRECLVSLFAALMKALRAHIGDIGYRQRMPRLMPASSRYRDEFKLLSPFYGPQSQRTKEERQVPAERCKQCLPRLDG